jgi:hypothetical protein
MTLEDAEALKAAITALSSNGETWVFLYCSADTNGAPLLIVEPKKIDPKRVMTLMRTAKSRDFVTGSILFKDGKPLLQANRPDHPQFRPHLREVFGAIAPALVDAVVTGLPETDAASSPLSSPAPVTSPRAPVKATAAPSQEKPLPQKVPLKYSLFLC